jgi:hypothetical protein
MTVHMNILKTGLMAVMMVGVLSAQGQTADEIMSKHNAAMGGDAWKKVNSLKKVSSMNAAGMVVEVIETKVRGKGVRSEIIMGGQSGGYEIATPTAGWKLDKMGGNGQVTEMTAEEVKSNQVHMDPSDDYIDYKAKGIKVAYIGKEELNGKAAYKTIVTGTDGRDRTVFFDAATYYKVSETERVETPRGPMDVTTTFSEFKKFPEGVVVAMRAKNDYQDITVKEVEINKPVPDSAFKP